MGKKKAAESPDSPEAMQSSEDTPDLAMLMAAIQKSEVSVIKRLDESAACLSSSLNDKIDSVSTDLREHIRSVQTELSAAIEKVAADCAAHGSRLSNVEEAANDYSDRVVALEGKLTQLASEVVKLTAKTEDLESRQRRSNCRIFGVKESGASTSVASVAKLLQDMLGLDYTPTLDRAHRSLQREPRDGEPPRPIIVKFHYFQQKVEVLQKASRAGPILHDGQKIRIYPDYTASVMKKRAAFTEVRGLLHRCRNTKFGILYPAILKITTPAGLQKSFDDPVKAKEYILAHLHPSG